MFKQHQTHCGRRDHYVGGETGRGPEEDPRAPKRRPRPLGLRNGNETVEKMTKKSKKKKKKKKKNGEEEEEEEREIEVGVGEHTISGAQEPEPGVEGKER